MPPSFPQYVTEAITGPMSDPPGLKLRKEGLRARHPVVFVPGIVTGGLELWEGHHCADGLFRKRLWGGTFGEIYKRYSPLESIFPITCLFVPLSLIGNEGWFGKDCLQLKWRNGTYILKFFLLSIMNSMFYKCKMTCDLSSCFRLPQLSFTERIVVRIRYLGLRLVSGGILMVAAIDIPFFMELYILH